MRIPISKRRARKRRRQSLIDAEDAARALSDFLTEEGGGYADPTAKI